ncbi:MAG: hypothetical protein U9Q73_01340 [Nanoarchaeota archaeon]|nr:hypothetical protein [Nanoarchaeota archaeon]
MISKRRIIIRNSLSKGIKGYQIVESQRYFSGKGGWEKTRDNILPARIENMGEYFVLRKTVDYDDLEISTIVAITGTINSLSKKMYSRAKEIAKSYIEENSKLVDKAKEIKRFGKFEEIICVETL